MTQKQTQPRKRTPKPTQLAEPAAKTKAATKADQVLLMLRGPNGATAAQIAEATHWQLHSVRGFIAGTLKKKMKLTVVTEKVEDETRYKVSGEAKA